MGNGPQTPENGSVAVTHLTHFFPRHPRPILDDVSFHIDGGQIFSLLGPNGAGKTTLVRILATMILPAAGKAQVCGFDVVRHPSRVRKQIALCSDSERSFYFRLSGYQNLEFFGGLAGIPRTQLKKRVNAVIEQVGLADSRNELFMRYSHGMKKKLSLARGLLADPQVYLLDEPTSGIDPFSATEIRTLIGELRSRGKTILLTTHNMEEASKMSDWVGILKDGKLVALDTLPALRQHMQRRRLLIEISPPPGGFSQDQGDGVLKEISSRLAQLPLVKSVNRADASLVLDLEANAPVTSILRILIENDLSVRTIREETTTLEDLFISLAKS